MALSAGHAGIAMLHIALCIAAGNVTHLALNDLFALVFPLLASFSFLFLLTHVRPNSDMCDPLAKASKKTDVDEYWERAGGGFGGGP